MKKRSLQIGITGGIGSGKSTICKIFQQFGVYVYDADTRAKWILSNDEILRKEIVSTFGTQSYNEKQELDRKYLASQVFNNSEKVKILNSLVHPKVGQDYKKWVEETDSSIGYLIKEAALMFESDSYKLLDKIINVEAPEELRIERVLKRDPFRKTEEIRSIIDKQLKDEERRKLSDYVIINDDYNLVIPQVVQLHRTFQNLS